MSPVLARSSPCAVSAIALTVVSKSTRRLAGISLLRDHEAGPRLHRAERASLDARNLHESGDRIAGHPEVMLRATTRRRSRPPDVLVVRLSEEGRAHRRTRRRSRPGIRPRRRTAWRCACTDIRPPPRREIRRWIFCLRQIATAFADGVHERRHHARGSARSAP